MTARLTEIDALAAIGDPAVQDVEQLAGLAGDPRVMDYFFSRVDGPGWLHALGEHQLLQPPAESIWSAFRYLMALASTHPEDTRTWLQSRPRGRDLNAGQARALLTVARTVKEQVADAVLRIVETHTTDVAVLHGIAGYLETLAEDEHSSEAVIGLLKRALAGALGAGSSADDSYLAAGMLRVAVSSASQAHPGRWLAILAAKFAQIADPPNPFQFRRLEAIGGLGLEAGAPVLQLLVVALRDVAWLAREAGVPTAERIAALEKLPAPLAGRLVALHLSEAVDVDTDTALSLLTREVADQAPMPETLALLRQLTERGLEGLGERMLEVLGEPPTSEEVAAVSDEDDLPASSRRAYGWLDAMLAAVKDAWAAANGRVEARWGKSAS